jgi:hypothetical protein
MLIVRGLLRNTSSRVFQLARNRIGDRAAHPVEKKKPAASAQIFIRAPAA